MASKTRFTIIIDSAKEMKKYYEQPTYKQWKQYQFLLNLEKLIGVYFIPFTIITLLMTWTFFLIGADNKYYMFIELLLELIGQVLIYLALYFIVFSKRLTLNSKEKWLSCLIFLYQLLYLYYVLQMNYKDYNITQSLWNALTLGFLLKSFSLIYSSILMKIFTFIIFELTFVFRINEPLDLNFGFYFAYFIIYFIIVIFIQEVITIREYKTLMSFLGLIETTLDAICIVNPTTKEVLYSNQKYDTLSAKFNSIYAKSSSSVTKSQIQLNFLQRLQLRQLENNDDAQLLNIFENDTENFKSLKLQEINFKSNQNIKLNSKLNSSKNEAFGSLISIDSIHQPIQQYFRNLKSCLKVNQKLEKMMFTSDIILKYQATPKQIVQERSPMDQNSLNSEKQISLRIINKNLSKFKSMGIQKLPIPSISKMKSMDDQKLNIPKSKYQTLQKNRSMENPKILSSIPSCLFKKSNQQIFSSEKKLSQSQKQFSQYAESMSCDDVDKKQSIIQHKIRLFVQQISNFEFFGQDDNIQIYTIQELTSIMLKTKIKKLEELKRNIMRSITHELVTYLTGAYGYLQQVVILKESIQNQQCQNLILSSFKCLQLQILKIQDLIDYKDILNEKFSVKMESISLTAQVKECIELIVEQTIFKKQSLEIDIPEFNINVQGDKQKFNQLLLNLIGNAIKFTMPQGRISITVKEVYKIKEDEEDLEYSLKEGKIYQVRVEDTGIGMSQDQLGRLVKKLHFNIEQVEKVAENSVGIGMGLTVCKEIISKMGPTGLNYIFVESQPNIGSAFYFYLKEEEKREISIIISQDLKHHSSSFEIIESERIYEEKIYELPAKFEINSPRTEEQNLLRNGPEISCKCNTIMVVDDEQFIIETLTLLIKKLGFSVEYCYDGQQALEQILSKNKKKCCDGCKLFQCIMMDINMPIMDGLTTVKQIRKFEKSNIIKKNLIMIAITGFTSQIEKNICLENGFDWVLNKPANFQTIKDVLNRFNLSARQTTTDS